MNTVQKKIILQAAPAHRAAIVALLEEEKLPTADLPQSLEHFLVALEEDEVAGAIGLEVYGKNGLLRSMVTRKTDRNKGIAGQLVQALEEKAKSLGLDVLYLLTQTASAY